MDLQWLAIIPILSLLMLVHELGHFVTARRAGIVVQEFGFGLPPRIYGYEHNDVIYSLNWIPFGAFVKMLGEEDPTSPGSFASKSKLTRGIVLAAGSGMNFLMAVVVFALGLHDRLADAGPERGPDRRGRHLLAGRGGRLESGRPGGDDRRAAGRLDRGLPADRAGEDRRHRRCSTTCATISTSRPR